MYKWNVVYESNGNRRRVSTYVLGHTVSILIPLGLRLLILCVSDVAVC